ncbi:hypothetical protein H2248_008181 [Termitomyces sp. 'cryptogamus']|nr:hypothetical protein H2248_008181 [Termitomyces sp. 'cryptogamus']
MSTSPILTLRCLDVIDEVDLSADTIKMTRDQSTKQRGPRELTLDTSRKLRRGEILRSLPETSRAGGEGNYLFSLMLSFLYLILRDVAIVDPSTLFPSYSPRLIIAFFFSLPSVPFFIIISLPFATLFLNHFVTSGYGVFCIHPSKNPSCSPSPIHKPFPSFVCYIIHLSSPFF